VFTHILNAVHARRPDGIVFLGDLECSSPLQDELRDLPTGIEIAYIPGNHDTDCVKNWDHLTGSGYVNLHATVMSICGVRIAGLGAYSESLGTRAAMHLLIRLSAVMFTRAR
jgi:hypothetical protein